MKVYIRGHPDTFPEVRPDVQKVFRPSTLNEGAHRHIIFVQQVNAVRHEIVSLVYARDFITCEPEFCASRSNN